MSLVGQGDQLAVQNSDLNELDLVPPAGLVGPELLQENAQFIDV